MLHVKNLFYWRMIYRIGGVETFLWEIARKYGETHDIAVVYREGDPAQVARLTELVRTIKWKPGLRIHAERAFFGYQPDMDGITLAARIKEMYPGASIVFLTAYKEFAYDAMSVRPSGYLLKPLTRDALLEEVEYALRGRREASGNSARIVIRTFGNFDVFVDGEMLTFPRSKAKEVLAYLVDQQGSGVRRAAIYDALWDGEHYGHQQQKYLDVIIRCLRDTLKKAGIGQILEMKGGLLRVLPEYFDCDLYRFVQGDPAAVRAYQRRYMNNYSWAELGEGRVGISATLAGRGRLK